MTDLVERLLREAADRIEELEADNQSNFDRAQTAIRERDEWKRKYDALVDVCNAYPTHGYDRNGSHAAGAYCCDCGYPHTFESCDHADIAWYKRLRALLGDDDG